MARSVSLGTLVTRCQARADKETDPHVDDAEWKALISEKYGELHSVVTDAGCANFEDTEDITATGAASYPLPTDMLSLVAVDRILNSTTGEREALKLLMPQERAAWAGSTGTARRYAFTGSSIELWPRPTSGTYRVTYIPQPTDLSDEADNTEVDLVCSDGEAFVIWGVAAMASDKGEADVRFKETKAEQAKERLRDWAINRAHHEPRRRIVEIADGDPLIDSRDWYYRQ